MKRTSSGCLHFFSTRMQTGMPVEKNSCGGKPMTVSMWPSLRSLVRMRFSTPPRKSTPWGQDDGHRAFVAQEVEAVQQEGEVGGGFGREAVALEAEVFAQGLVGLPAVAEGRIGDDGVALELLARVHLVEQRRVVGQGVAVVDANSVSFNPCSSMFMRARL
jgi:hypothetical protein